MFVDIAKIKIKAGNGGDGAVTFHREKYVASGGPDGGDGGKGGDIIFEVDDNLATLADFRYKRKYTAPDGKRGDGGRRRGKNGENLVIKIPRGTIIREAESNAVMADMSEKTSFVAAKGGRGGWGNTHFKTPTRQTPRFAKSGTPGEEWEVILELKLLADVGLLGFPNVGKSTFISVVSEAKPIIADYHFTTITPVLGVVTMGEGESFVVADIPGLIEGASDGVGLGHEFLRHVERCRMLLHIIDAAGSEGRDPIEDFEKINTELEKFDPELSKLPQIVAANKIDMADDAQIEHLREYFTSRGYEFYTMCAPIQEGTAEVINAVAKRLKTLPPIKRYGRKIRASPCARRTACLSSRLRGCSRYFSAPIWTTMSRSSISSACCIRAAYLTSSKAWVSSRATPLKFTISSSTICRNGGFSFDRNKRRTEKY